MFVVESGMFHRLRVSSSAPPPSSVVVVCSGVAPPTALPPAFPQWRADEFDEAPPLLMVVLLIHPFVWVLTGTA